MLQKRPKEYAASSQHDHSVSTFSSSLEQDPKKPKFNLSDLFTQKMDFAPTLLQQPAQHTSHHTPEVKHDHIGQYENISSLHEDHHIYKIKNYLEQCNMKVKEIGSGSFGVVWKITNGCNQEKALKVSKRVTSFREALSCLQLDHENIVQVDDVHFIEGVPCIEMEYCLQSLNVFATHNTTNTNRLNEEMIMKIIQQCCSAIYYLHRKKMVHCDIKPENILIRRIDLDNGDIHVVLADFGFAKYNRSILKKDRIDGGTPQFYAPELVQHKNLCQKTEYPFTTASDVYALGITIQRLLTEEMKQSPSPFMTKILQVVECMTHHDTTIRMNILKRIAEVEWAFKEAKRTAESLNIPPSQAYELFLQALSYNDMVLYFSPFQHKAFVEECVKRNSNALEYAHPMLRDDQDVVVEAIIHNPFSIRFASERLQQELRNQVSMEFHRFFRDQPKDVLNHIFMQNVKSREELLFYTNFHPNILEHVHDENLRNDREIILKATERDSSVLKYVTNPELFRDHEIALKIIRLDPSPASNRIDPSLYEDLDFVKKAITQQFRVFQYIAPSLKRNKELVLEAIRLHGSNVFEWIPSSLIENDREVVLEAVKKGKECPEHFYHDEEILKEAIIRDCVPHAILAKADDHFAQESVKLNGMLLKHLCRFQDVGDIVLQAVTNNGRALEFASPTLRDDATIVLAAVSNNGLALKFASDRLRNDFDIVKTAILKNGFALEYASEELQNNRQLVHLDLPTLAFAYCFASEEIRSSFDITMKAIEVEGNFIRSDDIPLQLLKDERIILTLLKYSNGFLRDIPNKQLLGDRSFMEKAIQVNPYAFVASPHSINSDKELMTLALLKNPEVFKYLAYELKLDPDILKLVQPDFIQSRKENQMEHV
ncbi:hypothetical protein C9374_011876 [Naegleria lovaniensis]|uniref:Protein kinase domain-containing protein n=1 Tax=Naegleria lovaniensis TaxID=51637 RepID=A0AA88G9I7_NAELO|nr:uncharacterized protein C9374_011876 [Naegleria lovaniensis]KAG2373787.1 hypothetical protein C9374_011876 [Naegleria lovaniensis]